MEEFKKPKPLKNIDSIAISAFLKGLVFSLLPFCILGFVYRKLLWEDFNKPIEAKLHLDTILKTTSKTDNYHVWASTLYSNIVAEEKNA